MVGGNIITGDRTGDKDNNNLFPIYLFKENVLAR